MNKGFFCIAAALLLGCTHSSVQVEKIGSINPLYHIKTPLYPSLGISLEVLKDGEIENFFLVRERGFFSSAEVVLSYQGQETTIPAHLMKGSQKISLDSCIFRDWIHSFLSGEADLKIGSQIQLVIEIQPWIEQYKKLDYQYTR